MTDPPCTRTAATCGDEFDEERNYGVPVRESCWQFTLRCMNPYCTNMCELPLEGRPAAFCTAVCKSRYSRRRAELEREITRVDKAIAAAAKKNRPELRRQRKALRFHLMRHPMIDTSLSAV